MADEKSLEDGSDVGAAEEPKIEEMMTSELAFLSEEATDRFGEEYKLRLALLGLDETQIAAAYERDKAALALREMPERQSPWAVRYFIMHTSTLEGMPKPEELTLSELIMITDDANAAFIRDHEVLNGGAWAACWQAAARGEAKFAYAYRSRAIEEMGWSEAQQGAFVRNECMILERLKWHYHENLAWTEALAVEATPAAEG